MAKSPDQAKAAILEATIAHVREKLEADEATRVERFVREYYAHVAPEDLIERSALDLYGAALAHWHLARVRLPGEIKVRVYSPNVEQHGWQSAHTVVETVIDDMPFLVDSVGMEITRHGNAIHLVVRPIVRVRRDAEGRLLELLPADAHADDWLAESLIHVEIDRQTEPEQLEQLQADLLRVLGDVRAAVEDWQAMRQRTREIVEELEKSPPPVEREELAETAAFLRWMEDDHFTFLGYREYDVVTEGGEDVLRALPQSGLGILREAKQAPISHSFAQLPPDVRRLARAKNLLILTKANSRATVHRPSYLDYVGVKRFNATGDVTGERRFLGLYTHIAYSASPWEIPVLRRKVQAVRERTALLPGSHDDKALVEICETYPRDELFQISEDELFETALGILRLGERRRVRLFVRRDAFGRFLSCLVYLPRERFNTENRERIQAILEEACSSTSVDYTTRVSESVLARLHFVVFTEPGRPPTYDVAEIEAEIVEAIRSWTDDLHDALIGQLREEQGTRLFRTYGEAFPAAYREDFDARSAVTDVNRIEKLAPSGDLGMAVYVPTEAPPNFFCFKLLRLGQPILLSDVLPVFENMGVRVSDERPYEVKPAEGPPVWIYDFGLIRGEEAELATDRAREIFQDAFARVWRGEAENDGFNRLVLGASLTSREIDVLRAIAKYLRQAGTTFSQEYMEEALDENPAIARWLVELFHLRLDPTRWLDTDMKARALDKEIEGAIDAVASLDEDRILRSFLRVVRAVSRTNYFQQGPDGQPKPYLSFKLDPSLLPDLPEPRPMFEVFVYSPRTEGVHLRGGKVARGGIRWSDRREDFRTEILGLMKAQMVKNAVIVPVGAKGGFIVKQPPDERDALQQEVVACYQTLIRGLLDLTDNIVDGAIVPPRNVVRHDGDDPYLVVAADKGTAAFSDLANEISREYRFWLGDAFASGGSIGYDHKQMGITARGAWESVRRHFREIGGDIDQADFTVVGIGDMSGDVFGNAMLLSRRIKLVGAFDHRHIFLDPGPDPEASFVERERLFQLAGSSWADYDAAVISPGGGVFPRTAKSISLSREAQGMLKVQAESLTPNELIRALLTAQVDLIYNGGIGTFVKAREESHAEVGDRANDGVRVDAEELRSWAVAEGGNLGLTQRARVAYALSGGRLYMDSIDNSAGVDCSDHEVNIKVLLDAIVAEGDLTEKQRNALLAEMEGEVAALVLRDNYEQAQAISTSVSQAGAMVDVHARYIRSLEQAERLDRELEALPSEEVLAERKAAGGGLTAPELAVLLSYTKIAIYDELLSSDVPEDPYLSSELEGYFPAPLQERFREEMQRHRLRREIVASRLTNAVVNRAGTTFAFRLGEETGASVPDIARALVAAREIFDLRGLWEAIEELDGRASAQTQLQMMLSARVLLERATRWLLRNRPRPLDIAATIAYFAAGASALAEAVPSIIGEREGRGARSAKLAEAGVPADLAERVVHLEALYPALDLVELASAADSSVEGVAAVYSTLGARLQLDWLRERVTALPREGRWEALARRALLDDLYAEQRALAAAIVKTGDPDAPPRDRVEAWVGDNAAGAERYLQVLADVKGGATADLATLSVAVREIRNLIESTVSREPVAVEPVAPSSPR